MHQRCDQFQWGEWRGQWTAGVKEKTALVFLFEVVTSIGNVGNFYRERRLMKKKHAGVLLFKKSNKSN